MNNSMTPKTNEWEEEVNLFIKRWCKPECVPHLLDSDDNDGQYLRSLLTRATAEAVEGERERISDIFDSFLLKDWSGEAEVYAEIARLKKLALTGERSLTK